MLDNGKRKGSAMNIEIAQRLYELRRKHGFSQESLAAELGLSRQAISKWERSESAPDMGNLIALADLYGMTIDELIRPAVKDGPGFYPEATMEKSETVGSAEETEEAEKPEGPEEAETIETVGSAEEDRAEEAAEKAGTSAASAASVASTASDAAGIPEAPEAPEATQPQQPTSDDREDMKQAYAHGHICTKPSGAATPPRCALRRFPYPLLVLVVFLVLALVFGLWEYIWLFLTIPFYYWIARVIERDPVFLERHGYASACTTDGKGVL